MADIVIIGAGGQLGLALQKQFPDALAIDSKQLDITDEAAVENHDWSDTSVVINAAAYTNVDGAETNEGRIAAWQVNAIGARNLAAAAIKYDLTLVHVSSDYVFDGTIDNHQEDEAFSPLGIYGQSKAAGDIAVSLVPKHYILRTSWVIGEGNNFVRTMMSLGDRGISPTVVSDQVGRLTFTAELAKIIEYLLTVQAAFGTYNATSDGEPANWADITREIFTLAGFSELTVSDTSTEEYFAGKPDIAQRPLNSIMDIAKLCATGYNPGDWHEALRDYIKQEQS